MILSPVVTDQHHPQPPARSLGQDQQRGGDSQRPNGQVLTTTTGARHPSSGYISPRPAGARSVARPQRGSVPESADPPAATRAEPAKQPRQKPLVPSTREGAAAVIHGE